MSCTGEGNERRSVCGKSLAGLIGDGSCFLEADVVGIHFVGAFPKWSGCC